MPPGGRRGRALASEGDKQPSEIPLYSALKERIGSGMFTCAPWGAEGASYCERRGQTTIGDTAIYCARRAHWQRIVHMCPLGGGGGELLRAKGTNDHRRYRYILRSKSALAADCSHVPPGGRRGRALASEGDNNHRRYRYILRS